MKFWVSVAVVQAREVSVRIPSMRVYDRVRLRPTVGDERSKAKQRDLISILTDRCDLGPDGDLLFADDAVPRHTILSVKLPL